MKNPDRSLAGVARDLWGMPAGAETPHTAAEKPDVPALPAWKGVDEAIDWTELLANGGNDPLAALAPAVLAGQCDAYRAAIDLVQPLADIAPYVTHYEIDLPDADTAVARFASQVSAAERREDACGIALRVARDLFSVLPVTVVRVEAEFAGGTLHAAYRREQLLNVRINAADPTAVAEACGTWTKEEENAHHCADTE